MPSISVSINILLIDVWIDIIQSAPDYWVSYFCSAPLTEEGRPMKRKNKNMDLRNVDQNCTSGCNKSTRRIMHGFE